MIRKLVIKNRSYRRFYENVLINKETLFNLVDLARISASGGNKQPLKYIISYAKEKNQKIFNCLKWATYLSDWIGPEKGERPSAYIIILGDTEISKNIDCDHGIASQSILLGATELGLGGCIIHSINRKELRRVLKITNKFEIKLVLAIGKPKEQVVIEEQIENKDFKYWRDEKNIHHVPKRSLSEIILDL